MKIKYFKYLIISRYKIARRAFISIKISIFSVFRAEYCHRIEKPSVLPRDLYGTHLGSFIDMNVLRTNSVNLIIKSTNNQINNETNNQINNETNNQLNK
jgi:hypothetical protein